MWKDVKPVPHVHADLIVRYAQLVASGEIASEHFELQGVPINTPYTWGRVSHPSWIAKFEYRIIEGKNHPNKRHDAIRAEWEAVKDKGAHVRFVKTPEGVITEAIRGTVYRIVGIADGWTDDPAKAGE